MDQRKSVLETTRPSDALGRLETRSKGSRAWVIAIAVVVALFLVYIVGTILHRTISGTQGVTIPSVTE